MRGHLLRAAAPRGILWTPSRITTEAWYDASDASTVTLVGSKVSQLNDKSGNARHVAQSTDANRLTVVTEAQNGRNVLRSAAAFLGMTHTTSGALRSVSGWTMYLVAAITTTGANTNVAMVATSTDTSRAVLGKFTPNMLYAGGRRNNADSFASTSLVSGADIGTGYNVLVGNANYTSTTIFTRLNGATENTNSSWLTSGSTPADAGTISIMNNTALSIDVRGDFGEMVLLASSATQATTERIEGYLAHRWGLTASLPSNHPFKTLPPTL